MTHTQQDQIKKAVGSFRDVRDHKKSKYRSGFLNNLKIFSYFFRLIELRKCYRKFFSNKIFQTKPRLDLYEEKFERKFLKETSDFYNEQAKKYLDNGEVGWYMTQVLQGLDLNIFLFFFLL